LLLESLGTICALLEELMTKRKDPSSGRQGDWFKPVERDVLREAARASERWLDGGDAQNGGAPEAKGAWLKHSVADARSALVLGKAFPDKPGWNDPEALLAALWSEPRAREVYNAVEHYVETFEDVTIGPKAASVGFFAELQFAAASPGADGGVRLALALSPEVNARLSAFEADAAMSDRLQSVVVLTTLSDLDEEMKALIRTAYEGAT
jgi:hypothetical protein